jgi:hypothetical protein
MAKLPNKRDASSEAATTDWWSEVAQPITPTRAELKATEAALPEKTDWWAEMLGSGEELRAGPPMKPNQGKGASVTGIADDLSLAASNLAIARASLALKDEDKIKRYAEHFGVPTSYFGTIDGEIVRWVPERNVIAKVVPTMRAQWSFGEVVDASYKQFGSNLGPLLPTAAATGVGVLTAPTGWSIPLAGVAAGFPDWVRRALSRAE